MALIQRKDNPRVQIDLSGPDGNVFCLIGTAMKWAKQLGLDGEEIKTQMMASDYCHAVEVFDHHFGSFCDLILPDAPGFQKEIDQRNAAIMVDGLLPTPEEGETDL